MKIIGYILLCLLCVSFTPATGVKKGWTREIKEDEIELIETREPFDRKMVQLWPFVFRDGCIVHEDLKNLTDKLISLCEENESLKEGEKVKLVPAKTLIETFKVLKEKSCLRSIEEFFAVVERLLPYYYRGSQFYFPEYMKIRDPEIQNDDYPHFEFSVLPRSFLSTNEGINVKENSCKIFFKKESRSDPVYALYLEQKKASNGYKEIKKEMTLHRSKSVVPRRGVWLFHL